MSNQAPPTNSPEEALSRRDALVTAAGALTIIGNSGQNCHAAGIGLGRNVKKLKSAMTPIKQRAIHDYTCSLKPWGGRLANSSGELRSLSCQDQCLDVIVIGSGYGGAITAARLAQRMPNGSRLAILERGREWVPGTFPDSFVRGAKEFRNGTVPFVEKPKPANQLGLYDMVYNDDINVLSGNALGGTSTINANVAVIPDADVFMQSPWPTALRHRELLEGYYQRAAVELNLQQIDESTPKAVALAAIGKKMCAPVYPADVSVSYRGRGLDECGRNSQGMIQRPCTLCADCTSGCNVGAKNTLQMNYLPLAQAGRRKNLRTDRSRLHREAR